MNEKQPIQSPPGGLLRVASPCVDICKYNKNNYCVGCKRHSDEITGWINYSDSMREAIIKDLSNRNIDE
ncbi:MAG TPA: DUF1289 domain-containing protein [Gammaproteobacteria bacterium]|jgi:predicted Fe-S protein YdhL (DUF1289 family)|nr:DUF1289 domain-containing protein [Gammaproteobacteria bacterium]HAO44613.1 DUF1289 domain-containing protein [Gammaproteobacteria bacterium]HAO70386.1 DUF1289 domain-containing protein [Gammaproteobacteria bacterium]HAO87012.1 DUF1289 domain-containing protein [Gammaproteobacteria bacterium]HAO90530.1 DUF1289 domain-containing protein [Gammaproteobacteria bacterium]